MKMVLCLKCEKALRDDNAELKRLSGFKRDRCGVCGRKVLCVAWDIKAERDSQTA